jgi:hypothetical protein
MADRSHPGERVIYLAMKSVFNGSNAKIRRLSPIRKLIKKNQTQPDIANLAREYGLETICSTVRNLLTEEIFLSTFKAKIRFPEVFDVSPAQTAEREASEAEAARHEATAIQDVMQDHEERIQDTAEPGGEVEGDNSKYNTTPALSTFEHYPQSFLCIDKTCHDLQQPSSEKPHRLPSLFPVYLPMRTQHLLLVKVQNILEQACFQFAQQAMPDILKKYGWDCPEAAELNRWTMEFLQLQGGFGDQEEKMNKPLEKLFRSVTAIRHTAVHRIRVSAKRTEQFILDAESLLTLLKDEERLKSLIKLRRDTQSAIEELERNKHVLGIKLEKTLKGIENQRAELDLIEKASIAEMLKEDTDYQMFTGINLEQTVIALEALAPAAATAMKNDTCSELGDTDSNVDFEESSYGKISQVQINAE